MSRACQNSPSFFSLVPKVRRRQSPRNSALLSGVFLAEPPACQPALLPPPYYFQALEQCLRSDLVQLPSWGLSERERAQRLVRRLHRVPRILNRPRRTNVPRMSVFFARF